MQKRAAGACCTIDDLFRQDLKVLAVVGVFITQDADRPQPAMADTYDLIAFAQGANGDRADRGIESRHIPAAGENTDHAFLGAHATALLFSSSMQKKNRRNRFDVQEASLRASEEHITQKFSEFEVRGLLLIWRLIFCLGPPARCNRL